MVRYKKVSFKITILFLFMYPGVKNTCLAQNYYRTMRFTHTPLYSYEGAVEHKQITDSIALYHFKKENEKLKSVNYTINGRLKPLYENYTCSNFIWASQNLFTYNKNKIIIRHFNYLSKPIIGKPHISEYFLDDQGRVISLKYYDTQNSPAELNGIHEYKWRYFNDKKVGEIRYSKNQKIMPMNSWFPYSWVILSFDDNQNIQSILTTEKNWKEKIDATKVEFEIANNEIIRWVAKEVKTSKKSFNTGPGIPEVMHDFDKNGYLIRTRFFDSKGNRVKSRWGHMGFTRKYNAQGNRLHYNFIDHANEVTLAADRGYSGQKFIWDSEGRFRLATFYIDQSETPVFRKSSGYSQIRFIYNYAGEEIGKIYLDENGEIMCNQLISSYILLENPKGDKVKKAFCK